jgi:hypothetical protein
MIPVIGNLSGKNLFINVSTLHIKLSVSGNSRIFYSLSAASFLVNYTEKKNDTVCLRRLQWLYRVSLMDVTRS